MKMNNQYNEVPHSELIKDNETIHIGSVFMFKDIGSQGLYAFLHICKAKKCTVIFDNENLIIYPESNIDTETKLLLYTLVINYPKAANDYMKYLTNNDEFQW